MQPLTLGIAVKEAGYACFTAFAGKSEDDLAMYASRIHRPGGNWQTLGRDN